MKKTFFKKRSFFCYRKTKTIQFVDILGSVWAFFRVNGIINYIFDYKSAPRYH